MFEFTEYEAPPTIGRAIIPVPIGKELKTQRVAVGAANVVSDAFDSKAKLIVGYATIDCRIAFGAAPVAKNQAPFTRLVKAGGEVTFWVAGGDKVAVIQAAA